MGADETIRSIVLAGEGKTFSGGADINWMRESLDLTEDENVRDAEQMAAMFDAIDRCPKPVIARVQGAALGGGCGLVAAADIVVAANDAAFGFTEVKLGIIPAVISTFVLPKIGVSQARALFVTGGRFDAQRAQAIGLVHEVVAPGELDARVAALVAEFHTAGPSAVAAAKALVPAVANAVAGGVNRAHRAGDRQAAHERRRTRRLARLFGAARGSLARGVIRRLLIANRGEIAIRIARGARELGISPVGVYSDADERAAFRDALDASLRIGPGPAAESYLDGAAVIAAAKLLEADAIHPGLRVSLRTRAVRAGGHRCGPDLRRTGAGRDRRDGVEDRSETARARGRRSGRRRVTTATTSTPRCCAAKRKRIGTPLLIKASAGGGGRGMRVVTDLRDFDQALAGARREALASFGDDAVLLERYLTRPRHIEFQILADLHGAVVHVGERECSIQRRHQKVVEEAPSPALDAASARAHGRGRRRRRALASATRMPARSNSCSMKTARSRFSK